MLDSNGEERLRLRVSLLRDQYIESIADAERASAEFSDKVLPSPDGFEAFRKALIAERYALREYTQAIADLTTIRKRQEPTPLRNKVISITDSGRHHALSFGLVPCDKATLLFERYSQAVQLYYEAVQIMAAAHRDEPFRNAARAVEEAKRACDVAYDDLERHRVEHGC